MYFEKSVHPEYKSISLGVSRKEFWFYLAKVLQCLHIIWHASIAIKAALHDCSLAQQCFELIANVHRLTK